MSSERIISVRDLSKCYLIYERPQDRLKQKFFWGRRQYYREFWALKNISLEVNRGETVGIIGRNGSGKSTLLQIIAGTLTPTFGEVQVNGRVAALLELGSGFNPEFTGRENVFLNGAILGLSRAEIESRFDEITTFADIGDFIDQPVKTYSSGMVIRLAFAVQAFVPKEILIVDETLAVGDELFQRKCFAKIEEFKEQGGTILFVSHASSAVIQLCNRALLLHAGELVLSGPSKWVVNLYHKFLYAPASSQESLLQEMKELSADWFLQEEEPSEETPNGGQEQEQVQHETVSANGHVQSAHNDVQPMYDPYLVPANTLCYESRGAHIFDAEILTYEGERVNLLVPRQRYIWTYHVRFDHDCEHVRFGMLIKTVSGLELGGTATSQAYKGIPRVQAGTIVKIAFEFQTNLASGTYFLNAGVLGIIDGEETFLDRNIDLGVFKVLHDEGSLMTMIVDFNIIPRVYNLAWMNQDEIYQVSEDEQ